MNCIQSASSYNVENRTNNWYNLKKTGHITLTMYPNPYLTGFNGITLVFLLPVNSFNKIVDIAKLVTEK